MRREVRVDGKLHKYDGSFHLPTPDDVPTSGKVTRFNLDESYVTSVFRTLKSSPLTILSLVFQSTLELIKRRIQDTYGPGWNIFICVGRYWSISTQKTESDLIFNFNGYTCGVLQIPVN